MIIVTRNNNHQAEAAYRVSRITYHILRVTYHVSRITFYVSTSEPVNLGSLEGCVGEPENQ
jgi:hypothetical protein